MPFGPNQDPFEVDRALVSSEAVSFDKSGGLCVGDMNPLKVELKALIQGY